MCSVLCPDIYVDHYICSFFLSRSLINCLHLAIDVSKYMKLMYPKTDSSRFGTTLNKMFRSITIFKIAEYLNCKGPYVL